jgi:peroxin-16
MESHRQTLRDLKADALRPSKWISSYENFVTKNVNTVNQVESALRSLTYIIPGSLPASMNLSRSGLTTDDRPIS